MSTTNTDQSLSEEELTRRLLALREKVPLSVDELRTLREIMEALTGDNMDALKEVIREWNFQKMKRELRKRNWPLLTLAFSALLPALGWFATWIGPKLPSLFK